MSCPRSGVDSAKRVNELWYRRHARFDPFMNTVLDQAVDESSPDKPEIGLVVRQYSCFEIGGKAGVGVFFAQFAISLSGMSCYGLVHLF